MNSLIKKCGYLAFVIGLIGSFNLTLAQADDGCENCGPCNILGRNYETFQSCVAVDCTTGQALFDGSYFKSCGQVDPSCLTQEGC